MGNRSARKPASVVIGLRDEGPKALLALHAAVLRALRIGEDSVAIWTAAGVFVYDWRRLVLTRTIYRSQTVLTCTAVSQDYTALGSACALLCVLAINSGHMLWQERLESPAIQLLLRGERLYAGFSSGEVHVLDTLSGRNLLRINHLHIECLTPVRSLAYSSQLELLFSAHSSHYTDAEGHVVSTSAPLIRAYEVQKGGKIVRYEGLTGSSVSLDIDETRKLLLVLSGPLPIIHIWSISSPFLLRKVQIMASSDAFAVSLMHDASDNYQVAMTNGVLIVSTLTGEPSSLCWTERLYLSVNTGSTASVSWLNLDESGQCITLGTTQGVFFLSTGVTIPYDK